MKQLIPGYRVPAVDATGAGDVFNGALAVALGEGRTLLCPRKQSVLRDCVLKTKDLPGLNCEMGTYRGGAAKLIGHYAPGKPLHLFDNWGAGLPVDDEPGGYHRQGELAADLGDVLAYLDNGAVVAHPGRFPGTAGCVPCRSRGNRARRRGPR